jgi:flagellar hook-basal body complex protein FliE
MTPIAPIVSMSQIASAYAGAPPPVATAAPDFASMVGSAAESAVQTLHQAEQTSAAGVAGKTDVQSVVQALSSAEVTLQTVMTIRDKVMTAYNDVMHMAV